MSNNFTLDGKTIFVTGASSGLGAQAAIECSRAGANVIISGSNPARLDNTLNQLHGLGHSQLLCDLSRRENIEQLTNMLPRLDGLALCAGITRTIPIRFITDENIDEIFQVNVLSSMQLIRSLLKQRKINNGGAIVFISSIATSYADVGNSIYAATKGAMNSFSKVLALEMAKKNITSNCLEPGFIPTRLLDAGVVTKEQLLEEEKRYPLGFGEPSDIANGIIYLLSDAAKWITGSVLKIDGGITLR